MRSGAEDPMRILADASGADDLESPPAEKTSKTIATGFGGPAAQPAVAGHKSASSAVDTLQTNSRGSMTVT